MDVLCFRHCCKRSEKGEAGGEDASPLIKEGDEEEEDERELLSDEKEWPDDGILDDSRYSTPFRRQLFYPEPLSGVGKKNATGFTPSGVNLLERRPLLASSPNKLDARRIKSSTGVVESRGNSDARASVGAATAADAAKGNPGGVFSPRSFTFLTTATATTTSPMKQLPQPRQAGGEARGRAALAASPRCGGFLTASPRKPNSFLTAELKGASSSEADGKRGTPRIRRAGSKGGAVIATTFGDGVGSDRRSASSRTPSKASTRKKRQEEIDYNMSQERVMDWLVNDTVSDADDFPSPTKECLDGGLGEISGNEIEDAGDARHVVVQVDVHKVWENDDDDDVRKRAAEEAGEGLALGNGGEEEKKKEKKDDHARVGDVEDEGEVDGEIEGGGESRTSAAAAGGVDADKAHVGTNVIESTHESYSFRGEAVVEAASAGEKPTKKKKRAVIASIEAEVEEDAAEMEEETRGIADTSVGATNRKIVASSHRAPPRPGSSDASSCTEILVPPPPSVVTPPTGGGGAIPSSIDRDLIDEALEGKDGVTEEITTDGEIKMSLEDEISLALSALGLEAAVEQQQQQPLQQQEVCAETGESAEPKDSSTTPPPPMDPFEMAPTPSESPKLVATSASATAAVGGISTSSSVALSPRGSSASEVIGKFPVNASASKDTLIRELKARLSKEAEGRRRLNVEEHGGGEEAEMLGGAMDGGDTGSASSTDESTARRIAKREWSLKDNLMRVVPPLRNVNNNNNVNNTNNNSHAEYPGFNGPHYGNDAFLNEGNDGDDDDVVFWRGKEEKLEKKVAVTMRKETRAGFEEEKKAEKVAEKMIESEDQKNSLEENKEKKDKLEGGERKGENEGGRNDDKNEKERPSGENSAAAAAAAKKKKKKKDQGENEEEKEKAKGDSTKEGVFLNDT